MCTKFSTCNHFVLFKSIFSYTNQFVCRQLSYDMVVPVQTDTLKKYVRGVNGGVPGSFQRESTTNFTNIKWFKCLFVLLLGPFAQKPIHQDDVWTHCGEFSRNLTITKYYSDRKKLVLNVIIQLDNVLSSYTEDSEDVKIPLFQALELYADLYLVNPFLTIISKHIYPN
ncbi:hypothetical protein EDC94DRAFT_584644 [Helicostylum pulchrum]|nr:hypothetical protein EDC94DRAFT_584644 [Helicostylum pulchrum]